MKFFLKAEPDYKGRLRVLEWFEQKGSDGGMIIGYVDDGIRKEHADIYVPWKEEVEKNAEQLYSAAKEAYLKGEKQ